MRVLRCLLCGLMSDALPDARRTRDVLAAMQQHGETAHAVTADLLRRSHREDDAAARRTTWTLPDGRAWLEAFDPAAAETPDVPPSSDRAQGTATKS